MLFHLYINLNVYLSLLGILLASKKGKECSLIEFSFYLDNQFINYTHLLDIMKKILPLENEGEDLIKRSIIHFLI